MNQDIVEEFYYYQFLGKIFSGILVGRLRHCLVTHEVLYIFQVGFIRDKQMLDNISVIKTIVNKCPRVKKVEYTGALWLFRKIEKPYGLR
jgi:hypothetical protein